LTKKYSEGPNILLIDEQGAQMGVVPQREAMLIAKDKGLELFIINGNADPLVGRLMDYGRFKFEQVKRSRVVTRNHSASNLKEIKMHYEISDHDFQVKLRSAHRFLESGDKIRLSVILRGREMRHSDLAIALLNLFASNLDNLTQAYDEPKLEGKTASMTLLPARRKVF